MCKRLLTTCLILTLGGSALAEIDFARQILPILSDKCYVCHGPDAKDDELRLDSFAAATADRDGLRGIDPDAPENSEVLARIHDLDDPMPPDNAEKQLTDAERALLDEWIKSGAAYAEHWAFVPPVKPAAASIDELIQTSLLASGHSFAPPADPATLARRASLVLTGLPPSPEALATFLADRSDQAYETFVDGLLASPRYGEHQARYWLDAVRYGDTHGLHLDNKRGIYPYRDWVVRALNRNMPFDEFVTWQLAGDLLPDAGLEQRVATGFVRMNPSTAEGGAIPAEFQAKNNFDRTETLGTVLLGMTMNCARCHTHKYDPIVHTEYYRLMAFFNSTAESPMDGNKYIYGPIEKAPRDQAEWDLHDKLMAERDSLLKGRDGDAAKALEGLARTDLSASNLLVRIKAAESTYTTTLVAKELPKPRETKVLHRGEYSEPIGDPLEPGILEVMGAFPGNAPRNRLGLAQWLTAREHPVVSRVLINRVWQRVFGHGIVRSPEDFGRQGQYPTHPELLDWLAVSFQENGWDLKHMLRLMVTSQAFCQNSAWRADIDDPENRLLARGPSFRLDAEVLRDIGLWASGLLDPHMGGEGVKPYQPSGMWKAMAHPGSNTKEYKRDQGDLLYRRSLYVYWKRTSPHPMMTLFDAPDRETSCVRRSRTSTALQSLGMFNETQRVEMGRKLAERLMGEAGDDAARLDRLFVLLASRPPSAPESTACINLLTSMRERYSAAEADAVALLKTGEAPRDETLSPVDVAAWTQVAMTLLASDLAILLY